MINFTVTTPQSGTLVDLRFLRDKGKLASAQHINNGTPLTESVINVLMCSFYQLEQSGSLQSIPKDNRLFFVEL